MYSHNVKEVRKRAGKYGVTILQISLALLTATSDPSQLRFTAKQETRCLYGDYRLIVARTFALHNAGGIVNP
jgi:hypothetical protein